MINYNDELRLQIVEGARAYMDAPYRHHGRTIRGIDCVGLIIQAYADAGVQNFDEETYRLDYSKWPSPDSLVSRLRKDTFEVPISDIKVSDIILMKWPEIDEYPRHVAMVTYVGSGKDDFKGTVIPDPIHIIQTHWRVMSVSEHLMDRQWHERVVSVHRHNVFSEEKD